MIARFLCWGRFHYENNIFCNYAPLLIITKTHLPENISFNNLIINPQSVYSLLIKMTPLFINWF